MAGIEQADGRDGFRDIVEAALRDLSGGTELHNIEKKGYYLTADRLANNPLKSNIVETVAHIANQQADNGVIIFQETPPPVGLTPLVDPKYVDDAIRSRVVPHVLVNVVSRDVGGQRVDAIIIPRTSNRPHLLKLDDGRVILPIRGAANNLTAARAELDQMYEERFIGILRQALPQYYIGGADPVTPHLERVRYGLSEDDVPETSVMVIPLPLQPDRLTEELLLNAKTGPLVARLLNETQDIDRARFQDWFGRDQGSRDGGLYFEVYAPRLRGAPPWSIRLYRSGTVIYRSELWLIEFTGGYRLPWFEMVVEATMRFADLYFTAQSIACDKCAVVAVVRHPDAAPLHVRGMFDTWVPLDIREPTNFIQVPPDLHVVERVRLARAASETGRYFGRILRDYFVENAAAI
jgi:hypothetical protein